MLHISLSAEKIFSIGSFPVTNSLLSTWIVMALLFLFAYVVNRSISLVPSHGQSIAEMLIKGLYDFFASVMGHTIKQAFPVLGSLFLFIIIANWLGLLPGVGTIGFYENAETKSVASETVHTPILTTENHITEDDSTPVEVTHGGGVEEMSEPVPVIHEKESVSESTGTHGAKKFVPLFRGATADLNTTLALALVAFLAIQYYGFLTLGAHYSKRFFNFTSPIMFFVGLLEIVSDLSKVISFAFRLFGNIFAGEVLLTVMAFLMPFVAPMPFLLLELFVGFIQALVFSTLTAVFINVAVAHEG